METYDLLQCIDRALDGFGSSAKQAVYLNLSIRKGIPYESIVNDPLAFTLTLQEVFDESSKVVKRAIAREITSVFNLGISKDSDRLEETFELARKQISGDIYR